MSLALPNRRGQNRKPQKGVVIQTVALQVAAGLAQTESEVFESRVVQYEMHFFAPWRSHTFSFQFGSAKLGAKMSS